mmetsp:Transcript_12204/g.39021  ORF Transcript_12204/g.39021 Transcript_12204/m.39021 type:complete len:227 (-) Transcript_12204:467-1147(-)
MVVPELQANVAQHPSVLQLDVRRPHRRDECLRRGATHDRGQQDLGQVDGLHNGWAVVGVPRCGAWVRGRSGAAMARQDGECQRRGEVLVEEHLHRAAAAGTQRAPQHSAHVLDEARRHVTAAPKRVDHERSHLWLRDEHGGAERRWGTVVAAPASSTAATPASSTAAATASSTATATATATTPTTATAAERWARQHGAHGLHGPALHALIVRRCQRSQRTCIDLHR